MTTNNETHESGGTPAACSSASIGRRDFIKAGSLTAAMLAAGEAKLMAGPFTEEDVLKHLIPADKKLDAAWVASLSERGDAEVFSGDQLTYVGMPIGGIGCGQLYLGGDGKLWLWDIFKSNYRREPDHGKRIAAFTLGGHYANPVPQGEPYTRWNGADVQQGFLVRTKAGTRTLDRQGFPGVTFRGEYPIGKVTYAEKGYPVTVKLQAFSPFIPLNAKDSALPATVMSYTVTNTSDAHVDVDLGSWMQNATCPYTTDASLGQRRNRLVRADGRISMLSTVEPGAVGGIEARHGYGSTTLTLLHDAKAEGLTVSAATSLKDPDSPAGLFEQATPLAKQEQAVKPLDELLVGGLFATFRLAPGESRTVDFAVTWYFPDYNELDAAPGQMLKTQNFRNLRRHYAPWFKSAGEVAGYLASDKKRLMGGTREWNRTWYDSTLPYWLLDRSFIPLDCVASQMFHWFDNGRPYGWEGVDCCPGTCTHVWHYAQALGRIFPGLERAFREKVDFKAGVGFNADSGMINDRGDFHQHEATDGQAGTILRVYREHLMSKDDAFLRRLWPNIRKAIEFLAAKDPDGNGLIEGRQPHTLDAAWFGPMGWISGLYLAALRAGEAMAVEMGDEAFAERCRRIADRGRENIVGELFDGEYFIHRPDPDREALQSGNGCHIDQVLGQAWAHQVGLGRAIPKVETVSALHSLWKYNFAPDAGDYAMRHRDIEKAFRWYAMPGEAGLLMCSWPKGGARDAIPGQGLRPVENPEVWTGPGGYFNECMNGFEYQVAAHMVFEGEPGSELVKQGLAITRAVHDRYAADRRNPYNEIECGDHYARSMASYGVFLAACGFAYHGPNGHLGFAPRISPADFKAPFTAAEGWGSYSQIITDGQLQARIDLQWGRLRLNTLSLAFEGQVSKVNVVSGGRELPAALNMENGLILIEFADEVVVEAGEQVRVSVM